MPTQRRIFRNNLESFFNSVKKLLTMDSYLDRHLGSLIAVVALFFGYYEHQQARSEFRETMGVQLEAFTEQKNVVKTQQEQFLQQETRLQRQRYTEIIDILVSGDEKLAWKAYQITKNCL